MRRRYGLEMETHSASEVAPASVTARNRRGGARVRFPPPLIYALFALSGVALARYGTALPFPLAPGVRMVIGVALVLGALSLVVSARIHFVRTRQNPVPWTPTPELIVQGIYERTRNPMYLGQTLLQLGVGTLLGNAWVSIFAALSLTVVHFIAVRPEEAYLSEKFGESYARYKDRVRRYV